MCTTPRPFALLDLFLLRLASLQRSVLLRTLIRFFLPVCPRQSSTASFNPRHVLSRKKDRTYVLRAFFLWFLCKSGLPFLRAGSLYYSVGFISNYHPPYCPIHRPVVLLVLRRFPNFGSQLGAQLLAHASCSSPQFLPPDTGRFEAVMTELYPVG